MKRMILADQLHQLLTQHNCTRLTITIDRPGAAALMKDLRRADHYFSEADDYGQFNVKGTIDGTD